MNLQIVVREVFIYLSETSRTTKDMITQFIYNNETRPFKTLPELHLEAIGLVKK